MGTVEIIVVISIIGMTIFIYLKNRQQNRSIQRRNRLAEKQEELIKMLTEKKDKNEN